MHDPMTIAFEIKRPWPAPRNQALGGYRYWPPVITVWHVDPEVGGDDDSCGFSFPRLTAADLAWAKGTAPGLWRECFAWGDLGLSRASTLELVTSLWCQVRRYTKPAKKGYIWKPLPRRELNEIMQLCVSAVDNLHSAAARARESAEGMETLLVLLVRIQRRLFRPWYHHPKWHVRHWRFQVNPLQALKRYLFSKCCVCGKHFPWGYSPISGWHGDGPRWFRSERGVWHHRCDQSLPAKKPTAV